MNRLLFFACLAVVCPASGATFNVNSTADLFDVTPGDGACLAANNKCTLRAAIQEANSSVAIDTIVVPIGVYNLTRGDLKITSNMNIQGAGRAETIIDARGESRVFVVSEGKVAEIGRLKVRNGFIQSQYGGCIRNSGQLTLNSVIVTGCTGNGADADGGGIANFSQLTVQDSYISNNHTERYGGGLYNHWSAQVKMSRTIVSGNRASFSGGGVTNFGSLHVSDSTFTNNRSVSYGGGGIHNGGTAKLVKSTFSANSGGEGGAIFTETPSDMTITNCTISGNMGTFSGGVANWGLLVIQSSTIYGNRGWSTIAGGGVYNSSGTVAIKNSIIAGNTAASSGRPDCYIYEWFGSNSVNYSVVGNNTGCNIPDGGVGNLVNLNPMLGPLANNGGKTRRTRCYR